MKPMVAFLGMMLFTTMVATGGVDTEEGQPVRKVLHAPEILEIKSYMGRPAAIFFQSKPQHVVINESVLSRGVFPVIERYIQGAGLTAIAPPEVQGFYQQELAAGRNPFDQESIYQRVQAAVLLKKGDKRGIGARFGQGENAGKLCFAFPYDVDKSPLFFEEATEQEVEAIQESRMDDLESKIFAIAQFTVSKKQPPLVFKLSVSGLREHPSH